MSNNNKEDFPWGLFLFVVIGGIALCVSCFVSIGEGIAAASQDNGFLTWLAVIGGVALFVFLIMKADR